MLINEDIYESKRSKLSLHSYTECFNKHIEKYFLEAEENIYMNLLFKKNSYRKAVSIKKARKGFLET